MFDLSTIIGTKVGTAVEVDGLWVPANSVAKALGRFVDPALFVTPECFPNHLSLSGSITKIRFNDRFFGLATEHQRGQAPHLYEYEQIGLVQFGTQRITTSHHAIYGEKNGCDATLYDFTNCVASGALDRTGWYNISRDIGPTLKADKAVAIGYPGELNAIDFLSSKYAAQPYAVWADPVEPKMSERLSMVPTPQMKFEPSGMSGGAVFGISVTSERANVFLAGLLSNASKQAFNFIPIMSIAGLIHYAIKTGQ